MYEQNLENSALNIDIALSMWGHTRITIPLLGASQWSLRNCIWKWTTSILLEVFDDYDDYSAEQVYGAVNSVSKPTSSRIFYTSFCDTILKGMSWKASWW
jgi:hypothetical protein